MLVWEAFCAVFHSRICVSVLAVYICGREGERGGGGAFEILTSAEGGDGAPARAGEECAVENWGAVVPVPDRGELVVEGVREAVELLWAVERDEEDVGCGEAEEEEAACGGGRWGRWGCHFF